VNYASEIFKHSACDEACQAVLALVDNIACLGGAENDRCARALHSRQGARAKFFNQKPPSTTGHDTDDKNVERSSGLYFRESGAKNGQATAQGE
jgi:hypothetical protein